MELLIKPRRKTLASAIGLESAFLDDKAELRRIVEETQAELDQLRAELGS